MRRLIRAVFGVALCALAHPAEAQAVRQDQAVFVEKRDAFREQLEQRAEEKRSEKKKPERELKMDFTGLALPRSPEEFQQAWHYPPISQGLTGSCWAFSSLSFFESEIHRLTGSKIKLSEMYLTYWEYVEKARRFVRERGNSAFGRGSQPNATIRLWKQYGALPAETYGAPTSAEDFHDDRQMFAKMKTYLEAVKEQNAWNEEEVLATIRSILDHYLGAPPPSVTVDGKAMTPQEYLTQVVALDLDDYVDILSLAQEPYYERVEYPVWDNWWHSKDYYNVPLEDFTAIIKTAVREGYTLCIVGDNSEPGFYPPLDVAMIPSFDLPSPFIDDDARQLRFSNESTTDDHAIHLVGYLEKDGQDWYLIKDSDSKARNGRHEGYMFYHEDYVKLKMMNFLVHRDIVEKVLKDYRESERSEQRLQSR